MIEFDNYEDLIGLTIQSYVDIIDPETGRTLLTGVPFSINIENYEMADMFWTAMDLDDPLELDLE